MLFKIQKLEFINKNFDSESNRNITMLFKIQKLEKNYLSFGA